MKRFLALLAIFSTLLSGYAFTASETKTVNGNLDLCIDEDYNYTCWAICEKSGSDAIYTVFDYDWNVKKEFTLKNVVSDTMNPVDLYVLHDSHDVVVSKGVFTTDGLYCVIINDRNTREYSIYNENGVVVGQLPVDESGSRGYLLMSAVSEGHSAYLTYNGYDDSANESWTFWSFEQGDGVNNVVAKPAKVVAFPNPVKEEECLTIELPTPADANTIVLVNDLKGNQEVRKTIPAGETAVKIPANRLSSGMNIYTLVYSNGESFSGKLIKE